MDAMKPQTALKVNPSVAKPAARAPARRTLVQPLVWALATAFGSVGGIGLAHAQSQVQTSANLPQGGQAVIGSATYNYQGQRLDVTTTNGAGNRSAINWQSFNVGAGHTTHIQQPNSNSSSLNRVVTNNPSAIFGTLSSNGQIILVNQNGIAVGRGGVVDTAGFTASTLNISDADYAAGRLRFQSNALANGSSTAGNIQIDGSIRSKNGDIVLLAPNINVGHKDALLKSDNGNVILGAGQSVEITGRGLEGVKFLVQSPANQVTNLGNLQGNAVGIFAGSLKHSGSITAQTAALEGGKIVLRTIKNIDIVKDANGADTVTLNANGALANGPKAGGNITIQSTEGDIRIGAGSQITANASSAPSYTALNTGSAAIEIVANQGKITTELGSNISANGAKDSTIHLLGQAGVQVASSISAVSSGVGGTVQILSPANVVLQSGATVDVSGDAGGGTILVGGDYQGSNAAVVNATNTTVSQDVLLAANANVLGNGGKVIVWADNNTYYAGRIEAKGGEQGGDGGLGETSGKKHLIFRGTANLGASNGRRGTLLLDPTIINIVGNGGGANDIEVAGGIAQGDGGAATFTISENAIELIGQTTNVSLQAVESINFVSALSDGKLSVTGGSLTLATVNDVSASAATNAGIYFSVPVIIEAKDGITLTAGSGYNAVNTGKTPEIFFGTLGNAPTLVSSNGSITIDSQASIAMIPGTNINANQDVNIRSRLGDVSIGFSAGAPTQLTGKNITVQTDTATKNIKVFDNASLNATAGGKIALYSNAMTFGNNAQLNAPVVEIDRITAGNVNFLDGAAGGLSIGADFIASVTGASTTKTIRVGKESGSNADTISVGGDGAGSGSVFSFGNTQNLELYANQNVNLTNALNGLTVGSLGAQALVGNVVVNNADHSFITVAAKAGGLVDVRHAATNGYIVGEVGNISGVQAGGDIFLGFNSLTTTAPITLAKNIGSTGGGNVQINPLAGPTLLGAVVAGNIIVSSTSTVANAGDITIGGTIQSNAASNLLNITSSSGVGAGGNISIGKVEANSGTYLSGLSLNSKGVSQGNVTLGGDIQMNASTTGPAFFQVDAKELTLAGTGLRTINLNSNDINAGGGKIDLSNTTIKRALGSGPDQLLLTVSGGTAASTDRVIKMGGVQANTNGEALEKLDILAIAPLLQNIGTVELNKNISIGTGIGAGILNLGGDIGINGNITIDVNNSNLTGAAGAINLGQANKGNRIYGVAVDNSLTLRTGSNGAVSFYADVGNTNSQLVTKNYLNKIEMPSGTVGFVQMYGGGINAPASTTIQLSSDSVGNGGQFLAPTTQLFGIVGNNVVIDTVAGNNAGFNGGRIELKDLAMNNGFEFNLLLDASNNINPGAIKWGGNIGSAANPLNSLSMKSADNADTVFGSISGINSAFVTKLSSGTPSLPAGLTVQGRLELTGNTVFTAGGVGYNDTPISFQGDIVATAAGQSFGLVANNNSVSVGNIGIGGVANLNGISIAAADIKVNGDLLINGALGQKIDLSTLDNAANNSITIAAGKTITASGAGMVNISAADDVIQNGKISSNAGITVSSTNGAITMGSSAQSIVLSNGASINYDAAKDITLAQLSTTSGNVGVTSANGAINRTAFGGVSIGGAGGNLNLNATTGIGLGGSIVFNSVSGNVVNATTKTGPVNLASSGDLYVGAINTNAGTNTVNLDAGTGGKVIFARNITGDDSFVVNGSAGISFGNNLIAAKDITALSAGTIDQLFTGALNITNGLNLTTTLGSISLPGANTVGGVVNLSAPTGDAIVNGTSSLRVQGNAGNAISIVANGIQVVGNLTAAKVSLDANASDVVVGGANVAPVQIEGTSGVVLGGNIVSILGGTAAGASSSVNSNASIAVNAKSFVIQGGSQTGTSASLNASGPVTITAQTVNITGGSGAGAFAKLDPAQSASLDITAPVVNLTGGSGAGAYAAVVSDGNIIFNANSLSLVAGTGADADAVVVSYLGSIGLPAACNGCVALSALPFGNGASQTGYFTGGNPPPPPAPAPSPPAPSPSPTPPNPTGDVVVFTDEFLKPPVPAIKPRERPAVVLSCAR